ncbi:MAG: low molecular weight protein arginine phosphatase [Gemmatimonadota bacterium]|nr:low molecular weight protein arginine phosphatase [Gemmatimonadota bacterium]
MNLLFVCTGNTCRSPAAEAIARKAASARGLDGFETASAGTFAFPGQPAAATSIEVAADRGIDLTGHRSREIGLELVEWADLVIAMTASHARGVEEVVPGTKVTLLNELLPEGHPRHGRDLSDPFGGDRETYEATYRDIEEALDAFFDTLPGGSADSP